MTWEDWVWLAAGAVLSIVSPFAAVGVVFGLVRVWEGKRR